MESPNDTFLFNPKTALDNPYVKQWRKDLETIENLIEDLCSKVLVAERYPLFEQIIKFFPPGTTAQEVKILGKAFQKYAELMPEMEELRKKLGTIDYAKKHPDVLALAFHDTTDLTIKFEELLKENNIT